MTSGHIVASAAAAVLVAATTGVVVGITGPTPAYQTAAPAAHVATAKPRQARYALDLTVVASGPGSPKFVANGRSSARIALPANTLITVVLRSYDNGTAPPPAIYGTVQGTVGNVIKLNGKTVRSVALKTIAHTFTVPALGLNVPIPAVTGNAKYITETFQFRTGKAGTFTWQCYAPCGTGSTGWGGPMVTPGEMTGRVAIG
jgi:hypothetical protein